MSAENESYTDRAWNGVVIQTRGGAELVLDKMRTIRNESGQVTVSDLCHLVDIAGTYVDDKWGWTDLQNVEVRLVGGGYLLDLPKPEPIDYGRSASNRKEKLMSAESNRPTDRTLVYEWDPVFHSGETERIEMKDVTSEFDAPFEADQLLNLILANTIGVRCVDPENEGYDLFDLGNYRFIARLDHIDLIKEKFYYDIKAVYVA